MSQVNEALVTIDRPVNGLITTQGFSNEYSAAEFARLRNTEQVYCEPNSGAIILRPNLDPVDMSGKYADKETKLKYSGSWYAMYADSERGVWGDWETRMIYGAPACKVEYQKSVETTNDKNVVIPMYWRIDTTATFRANQGFVCWFSKYLLPNNWDNSLVFWLGDSKGENGFLLTLGRVLDTPSYRTDQQGTQTYAPSIRQYQIVVQYRSSPVAGSYYPPKARSTNVQSKVFTLPQSYMPYQWGADFNTLSVLLVDRYIVIGINGLDKTIAMQCNDFSEGTDLNGRKYPVLTPEDSYLSIWGYGAVQLGFKKMVYDSEGMVVTPLCYPGEALTNPGIAAAKYLQFSGTDIVLAGRHGGSTSTIENGEETGPYPADTDDQRGVEGIATLQGDPLSEDVPVDLSSDEEAALTFEQRREREFLLYQNNVTEVTPVLYRLKVFHPTERTTVEADPSDVTGTIMQYTDRQATNVEGEYQQGSSELLISCYQTDPVSLFLRVNPLLSIAIKPRGASEYALRATHFCRKPQLVIKSSTRVFLKLIGDDLVRKLETTPVCDTSSFDERGWTDIQLMQYLIEDIAGFELVTGAGDPAYTLVGSGNTKKPNWQWQKVTSVWKAAQELRDWACKTLSVTSDGKVKYTVKPTSSTAAKYSIDAKTNIIGEPTYERPQELWRTSFLVIGKAGADLAGEYHMGEALVGVAYNYTLEAQLGMTVPDKPIVNPKFADWTSVYRKVNDRWDTCCGTNILLGMDLKTFELFFDLAVNDVISWTDPDRPLLSGKYWVLGVNPTVKKLTMSAKIDAWRLN